MQGLSSRTPQRGRGHRIALHVLTAAQDPGCGRLPAPRCAHPAAGCRCDWRALTGAWPCPPTCLQVFVTAQARCIDLATVYAQPSGALVVVSPGLKAQLLERLQKHIFPADKARARSSLGPA